MTEPLIRQIYFLLKKEVGTGNIRQADLIRLLVNRKLDPPLTQTRAHYFVKYALTKPIQIGPTTFFEPLIAIVQQYGVGTISYQMNKTFYELESAPATERILNAYTLEDIFKLSAVYYS